MKEGRKKQARPCNNKAKQHIQGKNDLPRMPDAYVILYMYKYVYIYVYVYM